MTLFSISIFLFQMSCKKETSAQTSSTSQSQLNLILYAIGYGGGPGVINSSASEYWIMNYDGSNPRKIPLTFSSGFNYTMNPRLSPDGKTIFFSATTWANNAYKAFLYTSSIDGTNLKTLLVQNQDNQGGGADIEVSGAY